MTDILDRLHFDAARCEMLFSKGVATNIEEAAAEIVRLREIEARARILIKEWHVYGGCKPPVVDQLDVLDEILKTRADGEKS